MKIDFKLIIFGICIIAASIGLFILSFTGCKNAFYFASPGTENLGYCLLNLILLFFTWSTAVITILFGAAAIVSGFDKDIKIKDKDGNEL